MKVLKEPDREVLSFHHVLLSSLLLDFLFKLWSEDQCHLHYLETY